MESRGFGIFCDIDGTILKHQGDSTGVLVNKAEVLPGVVTALNNWHSKGHRIILTTGRSESMRQKTEEQLREAGLFWDYLLMGIGGGERILINDMAYPQQPKAVAINLPRDIGMERINEFYHEAKLAAGARPKHINKDIVEKYEI